MIAKPIPYRGRRRPFGARRPYDPDKPPRQPSPAQEKALKVFRLRGLWFHAYTLSPAPRQAMQDLVDADLADLGVENQTARVARQRAELEDRLNNPSGD